MSVGPVGTSFALPAVQTVKPSGATAPSQSFGDRLENALEQVNTAQSQASQSARDWEAGRTNDLASVMVEQQVASLGFQLTLNVRNKALGAYRDIMNMPV